MIIIWDLLQPTFSTEIITEDAEFHEQNSNRTSWFFPKEIIKYQMNLLIHMNSLIHIKYQTAFQPLNIEFLWLLSMGSYCARANQYYAHEPVFSKASTESIETEYNLRIVQ